MTRHINILSTSFPRSLDDDAGIFISRLVMALAEKGCTGSVIVPKDIAQETLTTIKTFAIERFYYGLFCHGQLAFGAGIVPNLKQAPLLALQIPLFMICFFLKTLHLTRRSTVIQANWIVSGFIAWLVSIVRGSPYIITIRGEDLRLLENRLLRHLFIPAIRRASAIVTVSASLRATLIKHQISAPDKVHLIENGVDYQPISTEALESWGKENGIVSNKRFFLFVGTVIPRKNIEEILNILSQPSLYEYSLRICGRLDDSSEHTQLVDKISKLNLTKRISFEGAVAPRLIPYYLHFADAFITTSIFEGRPNAVLEALAYGKVVFASDIPAHREIIQDKSNGFIINDNDHPKVAADMAKVLGDATLIQSISQKAQQSISELRWEKTADAYLSLMSQM